MEYDEKTKFSNFETVVRTIEYKQLSIFKTDMQGLDGNSNPPKSWNLLPSDYEFSFFSLPLSMAVVFWK